MARHILPGREDAAECVNDAPRDFLPFDDGKPYGERTKVPDGDLVHQGILYSLHTSYTEEDSRQAEELLF